jgi:replicative DNA helicase
MSNFDAQLSIERTLLGSCLVEDRESLEFFCSAVVPEFFSLDSHRRIALRILEINQRGEIVNAVTVPQELARYKEIEAVGGHAYIADLTGGLPRRLGAAAPNLIYRLKEFWRLRELGRLSERIGLDAADGSEDSHSIIQRSAARLEAIVGDSADADPQVAAYTLPALEKWQQDRDGVSSPGLSFGISDLDEATGGMMPGQQTAMGASSGVGKTTALCQAIFANCQRGIACHAFLLEPTREEVLRKLWSMASGVRYGAATKPWTANLVESESMRRAAMTVAEWPLRLHDRSNMTLDEVLGLGRLSINRYGTQLIALDYIQRLKIRQAEKDEPLRLRVARASTALADLVKGTNCASLLLSQLTTGRKSGAQAKPTMYDFRESSQIENDAHTIILLHREYDEQQGHYTDEGAFFVPKQRFGSPCNIEARFDGRMAIWKGVRG